MSSGFKWIYQSISIISNGCLIHVSAHPPFYQWHLRLIWSFGTIYCWFFLFILVFWHYLTSPFSFFSVILPFLSISSPTFNFLHTYFSILPRISQHWLLISRIWPQVHWSYSHFPYVCWFILPSAVAIWRLSLLFPCFCGVGL